jgi:hypothetical protein
MNSIKKILRYCNKKKKRNLKEQFVVLNKDTIIRRDEIN